MELSTRCRNCGTTEAIEQFHLRCEKCERCPGCGSDFMVSRNGEATDIVRCLNCLERFELPVWKV